MGKESVQVLLATYNGELFLAEQIESVLANFAYLDGFVCNLLISDDYSSDSTVEIIKKYEEKDKRIRFLGGSRKGGVKNNFNFLIQQADADYVFFCDQDDFWLPNKMAIFLAYFAKVNQLNVPLLVHSDLSVVDSQLSVIHNSMFNYQKLNTHPTFAQLMVTNSVTGCVMAINASLLKRVKESQQITASIMHDWYIALIASAFGQIHFIPQPLILYRQHNNNTVGAKKFSLRSAFQGNLGRRVKRAKQSVEATKIQAKLFYDDFRNKEENNPSVQIAYDYFCSFNHGVMAKLRLFLFQGVRKFGLIRNSAFFIVYFIFSD